MVTRKDIQDAFDEWDQPDFLDESAFDRMIVRTRWPDGVTCPKCLSKNIGPHGTPFKYRCRNCRRIFSHISETVLANIKMNKASFFSFVAEIITEKEGRNIVIRKDGTIQPKEDYVFKPGEIVCNWGYTYKTSYWILKKIREHIKDGVFYYCR